MSPLKMINRAYPLLLPEPAWKLLGMYHVILNRQLLDVGQQQSKTLVKTIGAILTQFVLQNEQWIRQEFYRVKAEAAREKIQRFYSFDQLALIEASAATDIPDALRIGRSNKRNDRDKENSTAA